MTFPKSAVGITIDEVINVYVTVEKALKVLSKSWFYQFNRSCFPFNLGVTVSLSNLIQILGQFPGKVFTRCYVVSSTCHFSNYTKLFSTRD